MKASGITKFEGFPNLPNLTKLDLSNSKVEDINQLDHLAHLKNLVEFNMAESPVTSAVDDFKKELMVKLIDKWPALRKINDEPLAEDEAGLQDYLKEIRDEIKTREAEAEAKRIEEEEARKAAEAEAKAAAEGAGEEG
jgi:hypothetical protein